MLYLKGSLIAELLNFKRVKQGVRIITSNRTLSLTTELLNFKSNHGTSKL